MTFVLKVLEKLAVAYRCFGLPSCSRVGLPLCRCIWLLFLSRTQRIQITATCAVLLSVLILSFLGILQPAFCSPEGDAAFAAGVRSYAARYYADAAKHFEDALAHGNGSLDCYEQMAKSYAAAGNRNEAIRVYRQMEQIFKGGGGEQIAREALKGLGASSGYIGSISTAIPATAAAMVQAAPRAHVPKSDDKYFNHGYQLLKSRQFNEARKYFDYRIGRAPQDHQAHYYKALCHHYAGDKGKAKEGYEHVVANFPGSDVAEFAAAHLKKLTNVRGVNLAAKSNSPSLSLVSSPSAIPNETRVYFRMEGAAIMIPARVNGREFEFCFDTGAHGILIKKEDFDKAHLHIPEKAEHEKGYGIGGSIKSRVFDADVAVGGITKKVPISVTEDNTPHNLLGQLWFEDLEYEFDHKSNFITFRPSKSNDVASDKFAVPFRLRGKHIVVDVSIPGGKKTPMIVDTGAYGIMLTQKNFKDLDLSIPIASVRTSSVGVGESEREQWDFIIDEMRLGPIVVQEPKVSVVDDMEGAMGHKDDIGLLGMGFFGGWRYTIDNKNQVLRFFH